MRNESLLGKLSAMTAKFSRLNLAVEELLSWAAANANISNSSDLAHHLNALEEATDPEWTAPHDPMSNAELALRRKLHLNRREEQFLTFEQTVALTLIVDHMLGRNAFGWLPEPISALVATLVKHIGWANKEGLLTPPERPQDWWLFMYLPNAEPKPIDYDPRDDLIFIFAPLPEIEKQLREEYEPFDRDDLPALSVDTLPQWIAAYPGVEMELTNPMIEPTPYVYDPFGEPGWES